jgi:hypothetical protein
LFSALAGDSLWDFGRCSARVCSLLARLLCQGVSSCSPFHPAAGVRSSTFCCPYARFSFCLKDLPPFLGFDFLDFARVLTGESWYHSRVTGSKNLSFSSVHCALVVGSWSRTLSIR